MDIARELSKKGEDVAKVAAYAIDHPESIDTLIKDLTAPKGTLRYGFEKVLRRISEQRPDLIYPYFDTYADLLDSDNSFIKWGAILTIANLTAADLQEQFEKIFEKYFRPIAGPALVTAANTIGGAAKIALAKPQLTERIACEILKVEQAEFERKGSPSPECRNVAFGQAIDTFDQIFDQIEDKARVIAFVRAQVSNPRKPVAKRAEKFLKKHVL
jgi:hypothetical protein